MMTRALLHSPDAPAAEGRGLPAPVARLVRSALAAAGVAALVAGCADRDAGSPDGPATAGPGTGAVSGAPGGGTVSPAAPNAPARTGAAGAAGATDTGTPVTPDTMSRGAPTTRF